jgi:uncharacterized protein YjiK
LNSTEETDSPRSGRSISVAFVLVAAVALIAAVSLIFLLPARTSPPQPEGLLSQGTEISQPNNAEPMGSTVTEGSMRLARSLAMSDLGMASAQAIATTHGSDALYVFGPARAIELSQAGQLVGSFEIPDGAGVATLVAYDTVGDRLLMLRSDPLRVVEIEIGTDSGNTNPVVHDLSRVHVTNPVGIAIDPITGDLVIVDAAGPSLVRIQAKKTGFDDVESAMVDLGSHGIDDVSGVAFDVSSGFLYIIDSSEELLFELDIDGQVRGTWRLLGLDLGVAVPMAFAATGDQTDEPSTTSLYVLAGSADSDAGRVLELLPPASDVPLNFGFTSEVISRIDVASFAPPSPDPSGVGYIASSERLVVVDSEVDETVEGISHFADVNLWKVSIRGEPIATANISQREPTDVPMTNEPTGITWNSRNAHYFISDDNVQRVFDLNPGSDGEIGTSDDTWTSFSTSSAGNLDPEGVSYHADQDAVFVVDGVNQEVYQYTNDGEPVHHFDVARYGVVDPEGIAVNSATGTLFILGQGPHPIVIETTTTGELLRTIAIGAGAEFNPAGIAYAPASDGSDVYSFYISFRGDDNNDDPRAIDGVVLEMSAPEPFQYARTSANAGPDIDVVLPGEANLRGTATDDGLPGAPGLLLSTWTQVSGPGLVTFSDSTAESTSAKFTLPGTYLLRFSVFDGQLTSRDDKVATVTGTSGVSYSDIRIGTAADDAEEDADGSVFVLGADLDMMLDAGNNAINPNAGVGLRFGSIPVPEGATVVNAYVTFRTDEADSVATVLLIRGEASNDSERFLEQKYNLTSRPLTFAAVSWEPEPWFVVGEAGVKQRTPNLANVIQEIVDRDGWTRDNSLALIISGAGQRVATAFATTPTNAATLHLEWTSER